MYINDKLEYDIDALFPNISTELRYDQLVPNSEQYFTTTPKFEKLDYIEMPDIMANCSKFKKMSNTHIIGYCNNDSLLVFKFMHYEKAFSDEIINVTNCISPKSEIVDYNWDPSGTVVLFISRNKGEEVQKLDNGALALNLSFQLFNITNVLSCPLPVRITVYSDAKPKFIDMILEVDLREQIVIVSQYDTGLTDIVNHRSMVFKIDENMALTFLGEWAGDPHCLSCRFNDREYEAKLINGFALYKSLNKILVTPQGRYGIYYWESDYRNIEYSITRVYFTLKEGMYLNSKYERLADVPLSSDISQNTISCYVHDDGKDAFLYMIHKLFLAKYKLIPNAPFLTKMWIFNSQPNYPILENLSVKLMEVDNEGKLLTLLEKNKGYSYAITYSEFAGTIRTYKFKFEALGCVALFSSYDFNFDVIFCQKEYYIGIKRFTKVEAYRYQRERLSSNFKKVQFGGYDKKIIKGTLIADKSRSIVYEIELVNNLVSTVSLPYLVKDIQAYQHNHNHILDMPVPIETLELSVSSPSVSFIDPETSTRMPVIRLLDSTCKLIRTKEYLNYASELIDIVDLLKQAKDIKFVASYEVYLKKDGGLTVYSCQLHQEYDKVECVMVMQFAEYASELSGDPTDFRLLQADILSYRTENSINRFVTLTVASDKDFILIKVELKGPSAIPSKFLSQVIKDYHLLAATGRLNGTHLHYIGTGISSNNTIDLWHFYADLTTNFSFPDQITSDMIIQTQLAIKREKVEFDRINYSSLIASKVVSKYRFNYYINIIDKKLMTYIGHRINLENFIQIGLVDAKAMLYNIQAKQLCTRYAGGKLKDEISYLISPQFEDFQKEFSFFRHQGRIAVVGLKNKILVYDVSDEIRDPAKRLISIKNLARHYTDVPHVTVNCFAELGYLAVTLTDKSMTYSSETYAISIYGLKLNMNIEVNPRTYRASRFGLEINSSSEIHTPDTKIDVVYKMVVELESYNSMIQAKPFQGRHRIDEYRLKNGFELDEIMAFSSDISNLSLIQPNMIANVTRAIEHVPSDSPLAIRYPNLTLGEQEYYKTVGDILIYTNDTKINVLKLDTEHHLVIELGFIPQGMAIVNSTKMNENTLILIVLKATDYGYTRAWIYGVDTNNPKRYAISKVDTFCDCDIIEIGIISESAAEVRLAVAHKRYTVRGNTMVVSMLKLVKHNPFAGLYGEPFDAIYYPELHTRTVPYYILYTAYLFTDNGLVCYLFLENSGYLAILTVTFDAQSSKIDKIDFLNKQYSKIHILTRNSNMNCLTSRQDFMISCLIQYQNESSQVLSISLKFSFEAADGLLPYTDYALRLPMDYKLTRLVKGRSTDIAVCQFDSHTRVLFYDSETSQIVAEYTLDDLGHQFEFIDHAIIWESPKYVINIAAAGVNFREFLFERKPRKIHFNKDALSQVDYDDYFLVLHGVRDASKRFPLDKIFQLDAQIPWIIYISIFSMIGLTSVLVCAYFLKILYMPSDFDKPQAIRKVNSEFLSKIPSLSHSIIDSPIYGTNSGLH